jgi:phosphoribosylanthranilate isomerase
MRVKICGLRSEGAVAAAVSAGAAYVGFNFFPKSPRYVEIPLAAMLGAGVPAGVAKVALVVDAPDEVLDRIVEGAPFDMVQLHGHESPDRVAEVRARYGLPVMKVIPVAGEADLPAIAEHERIADQIMIDAKAPPGAMLPGGNGVPFDWRLIAGRRWARPWMLAGGLTADNVAEAARLTGARQVDVSSGVESAPGVKDAGRIAAFVAAAQAARG